MVELKLTLDQALLVAGVLAERINARKHPSGVMLPDQPRTLGRSDRNILKRAEARVNTAIEKSLDSIDCEGGL